MADAILAFADYAEEIPAKLAVHHGRQGHERRDWTYRQYLGWLYNLHQSTPLPTPSYPVTQTYYAFVNAGRWIVQCLACRSAVEVDRQDALAICVICPSPWHQVIWPSNWQDIETILLTMPGHRLIAPLRQWRIGWTMSRLRERAALANQLQADLPEGVLLTSMSIGASRVWSVGEILTAANENIYISDILDDLAGRDGPVQLEDSLEILDGSGGRYFKLPGGTTAQRPTGTAARLRFNSTIARAEYHDGSGWVSFGAPVITYEALNAAGDVGTGSAQVSAGNHQHIPGQPSPPGASTPTGDSGRTQIALTWTAPYAGSSGITSYTLAYSEHDANSWTEVSVTGRNYTVASLDHSTNYDFRVRARNSAGAGPFSEITSQATQSANAPGVPTSVERGGGRYRGTLSVRWTAPSDVGDESISSYEVEHRLSGTATWTQVTGITGTGTSVTGLIAGSQYNVQVRARSGVGAGAWSTVVTIRAAFTPGRPAGATFSRGNNRLSTTWTAPTEGSVSVGYRVIYANANNGTVLGTHTVGVSTRSDSLSVTIASNTAYVVRIAAGNSDGYGEERSRISQATST